MKMRKEKDILGELDVPADVYYGINTQRAIRNFSISGRRMPREFIVALAQVKKACALANLEHGELDQEVGDAILTAVNELLHHDKFMDQFPVDMFQTGSGTQTNVNMNEVLANRANQILGHPMGQKYPVHPNDHVNLGQSSNDVIPTSMHIAALNAIVAKLMPATEKMIHSLETKISEFEGIVKVGRTHLQDAVPIPLALEFQVYLSQFISDFHELQTARDELAKLPIGGTALGTGLNAPEGFSQRVVDQLSKIVSLPLETNPLPAEGIASHRSFVKLSGALKLLALTALKLANDVRWMASGPRAGLGELVIPENEPGSSIMPGKINPTQSEALIQVALQVFGYDTVISMGEGFGSVLDLNVAKPLIIVNILDAINILSKGLTSFELHCLRGLKPNEAVINSELDHSLMIVTRLSPVIGYDKAGEIARIALKEGKSIRETVADLGIEIEDLDELLDPSKMV